MAAKHKSEWFVDSEGETWISYAPDSLVDKSWRFVVHEGYVQEFLKFINLDDEAYQALKEFNELFKRFVQK